MKCACLPALLVLAVVGLGLPAGAEPGPDLAHPSFQIGLGTSIGSDTYISADGSVMTMPLSYANFYVPILLSKIRLKLEPELGLSGEGREGIKSRNFRIGTGVFYMMFIQRLALQFGFRAGLSQYTVTADMGFGSESQSSTDSWIGAAVGAEYFFSEQFSLGLEVQLNYVALGDFSSSDDNDYQYSNRSHFFARFYFLPRCSDAVDVPPPAPPPVAEESVASPKPVREVPPAAVPGPAPAPGGVDAPAPVPLKPPVVPGSTREQTEAELAREEEKAAAAAAAKAAADGTPACPAGTSKTGKAPPGGYEQYCARVDEAGQAVKDGWFRAWFGNHNVAAEGQYQSGRKTGKWSFYYNNGKKRLEAEYLDDKKHGVWVYWNREGEKLREVRYQDDFEVNMAP